MIFKDSEMIRGRGNIPVDDGSGYRHLVPTTDTYVLTLDSTQPLGMKWGPAGGDLVAAYIIKTADVNLPNAQVLGSLATGLLKVAATTGVLSTATAGTDYLTSVATANINAGAVTYAKIQNVSAHAILGNPTGNAAAPSEITLGANLSFSGTTLVASGSSSGDTTAAYIIKTADVNLPNAQVLGSLATGLLKVATSTGVLSTAVAGTDYVAPTGSGAGLTGITASQVSGAPGGIVKGAAGVFTAASANIDYVSPSGTWSGNSSITTLGTITTGTWQGTVIGTSYLPSTGLTITQWTGGLGTGVISSGTATFNLGTYNRWTLMLDHTQTVTLALSNVSVGQQFTIALSQDSTGSCLVTWFSGIKWAGGSAPTLTTTASKGDLFTFLCVGAGSYWGMIAGQNF